MKKLLLALIILSVGSLYAIDNNVELIKNKDFSDPDLFATQASLAVTDTPGKWFAGNVTEFSTNITNGFFESTTQLGNTFFNYFLGQITSETLNAGRYHLSLRTKGTASFYLKLSGTNALGAEWVSSLKNVSGDIQKSADYATYSIEITPSSDWVTIEADLDISIQTDAAARLYFVFPNPGSVSLDDVSFMRTGDMVVYNTYYVRPDGDNTSWTNLAGIESDQIITSSNPDFIPTQTYYLAKGSYKRSGIVLTTGKIYGGFSGQETSIDLSARQLSDKDGNGIVEPWEMTNETVINGTHPITGDVTSTRLITVTGGEINGLTIQDHFCSNSGAVLLGFVATQPTAANDIDSNAGIMRFCTIRKIKASANAPVMSTNKSSVIDYCLIEECSSTSTSAGATGAMFFNAFGGKISNSVLRNNAALSSGAHAGAIRSTSPVDTDMNTIVENCVIYNNASGLAGGAIRGDAKTNKRGIQIINSTIVNNLTTGTGYASVDLISGGLIVNSIVVDDPINEVRANSINNYVSNCAIGQLATPITNYYPNTDVITELTANDFSFKKPTTFAGVMIPGSANFDQAAYDEIRTANFTITEDWSMAVETPGLRTLPNTFQVSGIGATIGITASIPHKDILGVNRPVSGESKVTLGAYQFDPTSGLRDVVKNFYVYGADGTFIVNGAEGQVAVLYSPSGQLIKSVQVYNNKQYIPADKGFYIVSVGGEKSKVLVR